MRPFLLILNKLFVLNMPTEVTIETVFPESERQDLEPVGKRELKLKDYQRVLAEPCLQGENRLIIAPTNSGKTFVAMEVAKVGLFGSLVMGS